MADHAQQSERKPAKAWYRRWWIWLLAAVVLIGGVGNLLDPGADSADPEAIEPAPGASLEPSPSGTAQAPDLARFLADAGIPFSDAEVLARKAIIFVPAETTNEQAAQIAEDAMLYFCGHATRAGESAPLVNRVEVTDGVSPMTPGYDAASHPAGFASEQLCGN